MHETKQLYLTWNRKDEKIIKTVLLDNLCILAEVSIFGFEFFEKQVFDDCISR